MNDARQLLANPEPAHHNTDPCVWGLAAQSDQARRPWWRRCVSYFATCYDIYVITNDIYTKEDQLILTRAEALPADRIMGVETGGCPHTAIREDASMNLVALDDMNRNFPGRIVSYRVRWR